MPAVETLFTNALLPDGKRASLAIDKGRFTAIVTDGGALPEARETVDLGGALLAPSFVEGHIHLDTSFYGEKWKPHIPCTNGFDVHERVAFQAQNLANAGPIEKRARDQLELCIAQGTMRMRSHVMVDGSVGLKHAEAILSVREQYRDLIDLQLVAFPQNGILASPGTPELLDQAVAMGFDLVGGLDPATFDRNVEAHLDVVFGIAEKRGVDVDIHLHDGGTLGVFEIEQIAARTRALGMQGHVAVSHAYSLGDIPAAYQQKTAAMLAESGVAIMTNAPGSYSFPPVTTLRKAGVTVFSGSDNIRDSWWPYGDGDMLSRANIIGYRSGFYEDWELVSAFDIVTSGGAKALGLDAYGFVPGAKADFVTLAAVHVPEAVVAVPKERTVYRGGKPIARDGKMIASP
ncbi:MAG: amidohydrolase family protein [Bauldia sp.]|nr:amidohydrolase family protein [Bauldia sp.]